jgi:hypothetical protein
MRYFGSRYFADKYFTVFTDIGVTFARRYFGGQYWRSGYFATGYYTEVGVTPPPPSGRLIRIQQAIWL